MMSYSCNGLRTERAICARICCTGNEILFCDWLVLFSGCRTVATASELREQFAPVFGLPAGKNSSLIGGSCFQDVLQLWEPQKRDKAICTCSCCTGREVLVSDWWVLFSVCPTAASIKLEQFAARICCTVREVLVSDWWALFFRMSYSCGSPSRRRGSAVLIHKGFAVPGIVP